MINLGVIFTIYAQIMSNNPQLNRYYAMEIAVINTEMAEKYQVEPELITAIQMQESSYNLKAKNGRDCGIMQVGPLNQRGMKVSCAKLRTSLRDSIESGVKVLAWFRKTYRKREAAWWCRYNTGTKPVTGKRKPLCRKYVDSVLRWFDK